MNEIKNNELLEVVSTRKPKNGVKQKLLASGLAVLLSLNLFALPAQAATQTYPDVYVNDSIVTMNNGVSAFVSEEGVTYIPLAATLKGFGYYTVYNKDTKDIISSSEYGTLYLKDGEKVFTLNGSKYNLEAPVKIINGVTYVPAYVISKTVGADTEWNNESYRVNFVTNEKKVDEERLEDIVNAIDKNKNLTYTEKSNVKTYVKKYFEFMNPNLDECERMTRILSSLDIQTKYNGSNSNYFSINKNTITVNGSRTGTVSTYDAVRNALTRMFSGCESTLLKYGMSELVSAEINKDNTNQDLDLINVCKMLSDIIGRDTLLKAYKDNDMNVIKEALMDIYKDEALYNNFLKLVDRVYNYNYAHTTNQSINGLSKSKMARDYEDTAMNIYGILDVYYQCKYGFEIGADDVMQGYYNELLTHGTKKSFRTEPRVFNDDMINDYVIIYRTPQNGYNYGTSSYYYYNDSRPINYLGDGQVLELN